MPNKPWQLKRVEFFICSFDFVYFGRLGYKYKEYLTKMKPWQLKRLNRELRDYPFVLQNDEDTICFHFGKYFIIASVSLFPAANFNRWKTSFLYAFLFSHAFIGRLFQKTPVSLLCKYHVS